MEDDEARGLNLLGVVAAVAQPRSATAGVALGGPRDDRASLQVRPDVPRRPPEHFLAVPSQELLSRPMVGVRRWPDGPPVVRQQQLAEPGTAVQLL